MKTVPVPPSPELPSTRYTLQPWRPIPADQVARPRGYGARLGSGYGRLHQKQSGALPPYLDDFVFMRWEGAYCAFARAI
jgi:hypothetical protein